jgi:GAF domain-containing protein
MADQVAVALDNAHLFAESQAALEAIRRMYGEQSRQAWQQMVQTRSLRYLCTSQSIYPIGGQWGPEMVRARKTGQPAQDGSSLAVPIKVRDQILGAIRLRKSDPTAEWTAEETALLQTLTEQLGVALESARLYQDTQNRAAREQLAAQITARMRESLDVDRVLQIAAREFGETLGASEVKIRLTTDDRRSTPQS